MPYTDQQIDDIIAGKVSAQDNRVTEQDSHDDLLASIKPFSQVRRETALAPQQQKLSPPSYWDVIKESAKEGVTGIPDMFLNTPSNIENLGKAAYGTATTFAGHPEMAPDILPPPSPVANFAIGRDLLDPSIMQNATEGQSLLAAGVRGAVGGALSMNPLAGAAIGGASGIVGQGVEDVTGSPALGIMASMAAPVGLGAARNAMSASNSQKISESVARDVERNKTIQQAVDSGLIIPPKKIVGAPDPIRVGAASIVPSELHQKINQKNIQTIDNMAREQMGVSTLSDKSINGVKQKWADYGYAPIKGLPDIIIDKGSPATATADAIPPTKLPTAKALEIISEDRAAAHKILGQIDNPNIPYDPNMRKNAEALLTRAQNTEDALEAHVSKMEDAGVADSGAMEKYREARKHIAIASTYHDALNPALGTIDPKFIGKKWDNKDGRNYMTGNLETIGRFATAHPEVSSAETKIGASADKGFFPIARGIGYSVAPVVGTVAGSHFSPEYAAGGAAAGIAVDAIPALARNYVMSKKYQQKLPIQNRYTTSIPNIDYNNLGFMMGLQGTNALNLSNMMGEK